MAVRKLKGLTWSRAAGALVTLMALACGACGYRGYPQTTLHPQSDYAQSIQRLLETQVFWVVVIFVLVEGALIVTVVRFRSRPGAPDPKPVHGNTVLEVAWTIAPALILAFVAVPTVLTIFKTQGKAPPRRARGQGGGAPVVVGVPVPRVRHHHRERAARAGRPHGVALARDR